MGSERSIGIVGVSVRVSALPLAAKAASLIEKETLARKFHTSLFESNFSPPQMGVISV